MTSYKSLPGKPDIECAVLGAMLIEPDETIPEVINSGASDLFVTSSHISIYNAIESLFNDGAGIDQLTVADCLERRGELKSSGGEVTITKLVSDTVSTANLDYHLKILREALALRHIALMTASLSGRCYEPGAQSADIIGELKSHIDDLRRYGDGVSRSVSDEIRAWVAVTDGDFNVTDCYRDLQFVTKRDKANARKILSRLCSEGFIERSHRKNGVYRRIDSDCERMNWLNAPTEPLDIRWPGEIETLVELMPGSIAVIAGEPNAGKTAFLLNIVRMNMKGMDIHYFSSEMGESELRKRIDSFGSPDAGTWRFKAWERSGDFADVIRPDAVNIIDYMEIHEDFYRVGAMIKNVFDRLKIGVAIIAIQKNKGTDIGRGGISSLEKPRLYCSLKPGALTIVKGKNWATHRNPNGLWRPFTLESGALFSWENWRSPSI